MVQDKKEMKGFKMQIEEESKAQADGDLPKAKFNPQVEREKWIIEELMKPPGWSPYDYPESERDKINFDGWKKEKEVEQIPKNNTQSGAAGLESLFTQSSKACRATSKEERKALIVDLDKDIDESKGDEEMQRRHQLQQKVQDSDLTMKMEGSLKMTDDDDDVDEIENVEDRRNESNVEVRKQAWGSNQTKPTGDFFTDGNQRQETFKPKIQFLSGEEDDDADSFLKFDSSSISKEDGPLTSEPIKWAQTTKNKCLIEELPDEGVSEPAHAEHGSNKKSMGSDGRVQSGETEQSRHLLRGLQEMDSTGFTRKGVIEFGAGDGKQPFQNFDDDVEDDGRDDVRRGAEKKVLIEELDDKEEEEGSGAAAREGGGAEEFLRRGGVVDYNLNTFGYQ